MRNDEFNKVTVRNESNGFANVEFGSIQNNEFTFFSDNKININDEINEQPASNDENVGEDKKKEDKNENHEQEEKLLEKELNADGSAQSSPSSSGASGSSSSSASGSSSSSSAAASSSSAAAGTAATVGAAVIAIPTIVTAIAATVFATKVLTAKFDVTETQINYEVALEVDEEDKRAFEIQLLYSYEGTTPVYLNKTLSAGDNTGTFSDLASDTEYEITVIGYEMKGDSTVELMDGSILFKETVKTAAISPVDPGKSEYYAFNLTGTYDVSVESETYTGSHLQKIRVSYIDNLEVFSDFKLYISTDARGQATSDTFTYSYPIYPNEKGNYAFNPIDDAEIVQGDQITDDILQQESWYCWLTYEDSRSGTQIDEGLSGWQFTQREVTSFAIELEGTYQTKDGYVYIPYVNTNSGFDTDALGDLHYKVMQEPASEQAAFSSARMPESGASDNIVFDANQIIEAQISLGQCLLVITTEYYGHEITMFWNYISLSPDSSLNDYTIHETADFDNNKIYVTLDYYDDRERFSDFTLTLSYSSYSFDFPLRPISSEKQEVLLETSEIEGLYLDKESPKTYTYTLSYYDSKLEGTYTWGNGEVTFTADPMLNYHNVGSLYCVNPQDVITSEYYLPLELDMSNADSVDSLAIAFDVYNNLDPIDPNNPYWDGGISEVNTLTTIYDFAPNGWRSVDVSSVMQDIFEDPTGQVQRDYTTINDGDTIKYTLYSCVDYIYKELATETLLINFSDCQVYGAAASTGISMADTGMIYNNTLVYSNSYNSISSIGYLSISLLDTGAQYFIPVTDFSPDGSFILNDINIADAYTQEPQQMDDPDIGDPIGVDAVADIFNTIQFNSGRAILNVYYSMSDDSFTHTNNSYVIIINPAV